MLRWHLQENIKDFKGSILFLLILLSVFLNQKSYASNQDFFEQISVQLQESLLLEENKFLQDNSEIDIHNYVSAKQRVFNEQEVRFGLWSEFLKIEEIRPHLAQLAKLKIRLFLGFREEDLKNENLYRIVKEAQELGIDVRPWPILSEEEGYWINKWNVDLYKSYIEKVLRSFSNRRIYFQWMVLDLEPPPALLWTLIDYLKKLQFVKIIELLKEKSADIDYQTAVAKFQNLVNSLHAKGLKVQLVTNPLSLHDFTFDEKSQIKTNDARVQGALGIPLVGIEWDEISVMAYRPMFEMFLGPLSSEMVHHYGLMNKKLFQDKACIDLGPIGSAGIIESKKHYSHPSQIAFEVRAARTLGYNCINFYSLDGMLSLRKKDLNPLWFISNDEKFTPKYSLKWKGILKAIDGLRLILPKANE